MDRYPDNSHTRKIYLDSRSNRLSISTSALSLYFSKRSGFVMPSCLWNPKSLSQSFVVRRSDGFYV